jgi:hypothetical protein
MMTPVMFRHVDASWQGNGTPATDAERIGRLEHVTEAMQQALDIQFRRIAYRHRTRDRGLSGSPVTTVRDPPAR